MSKSSVSDDGSPNGSISGNGTTEQLFESKQCWGTQWLTSLLTIQTCVNNAPIENRRNSSADPMRPAHELEKLLRKRPVSSLGLMTGGSPDKMAKTINDHQTKNEKKAGVPRSASIGKLAEFVESKTSEMVRENLNSSFKDRLEETTSMHPYLWQVSRAIGRHSPIKRPDVPTERCPVSKSISSPPSSQDLCLENFDLVEPKSLEPYLGPQISNISTAELDAYLNNFDHSDHDSSLNH